MNFRKWIVTLGVFVTSLVIADEQALPLLDTNEVVNVLLEKYLRRSHVDPVSLMVSRPPDLPSSQTEFFLPRRGVGSEDLRACFDWYLNNLHVTAATNGVFSGGNARALVAIEACRAISYTNAISALMNHAGGSYDESRIAAIETVLDWGVRGNAMIDFLHPILTNENEYTSSERREVYKKVSAVMSAGNRDEEWLIGMSFVYSNRTDSVGAVIVDKLLVKDWTGYSTSIDRLEAARAILADVTNITSTTRYYFESVTNELMQSSTWVLE